MPLTWTTPCATRPVASIVEERKSWNSNVEIDSLKKRLYNNHTLWILISDNRIYNADIVKWNPPQKNEETDPDHTRDEFFTYRIGLH